MAPFATIELGNRRWSPAGGPEQVLRQGLAASLRSDDIVELVLFGSLARGTTTGYSDVDAILVVSDEAADDSSRLRALRPRVLAAQREVLEFQSMQHHGFLVATPRLLTEAGATTGLPSEALEETVSLFGSRVHASFHSGHEVGTAAFNALAKPLLDAKRWPRHPWYLHRLVAMFELVPVAYLQATGRPCAKHRSFGLARSEFEALWSPYDALADVRERWPREAHGILQAGVRALRNPWTAVALWRRLPISAGRRWAALLDDDCLRRLQRVVRAMTDDVMPHVDGSARTI